MGVSLSATQSAQLDKAISAAAAGPTAGKSLAAIKTSLASYLTSTKTDAGSNGDGLAFTTSEINSIESAFSSITASGPGFVTGSKSGAGAAALWEQQLHALFPTFSAPVVAPSPGASSSPVQVTPPSPSSDVVVQPPPAAPSTTTDMAALLAQLQKITNPSDPSTIPPATPNPNDPSTLPPGSTTGTTDASSAAANTLAAALASAQAGTAGSGSIAGGTGYADTGTTGLTATPTTTSGPDTMLIVIVLGLAAVGVLFWWMHRKGKAAHPAPAGAA